MSYQCSSMAISIESFEDINEKICGNYYLQSFITHSGQQFYGSSLFNFHGTDGSDYSEAFDTTLKNPVDQNIELNVQSTDNIDEASMDISENDYDPYGKFLHLQKEENHLARPLFVFTDTLLDTSDNIPLDASQLDRSLLMPVFYVNLDGTAREQFINFMTLRGDH